MNRIYLDWNATAPLLDVVRDAMHRSVDESWGNASSIHMEGQSARSLVERARRAVAAAVNAPPQSVVLTGGATESNNQVLRDFVHRFGRPVACSAVEHPSVIEVVADLAVLGHQTHVLGVDEHGRLDADAYQEALDGGAGLISVMMANNEIGNVYPVAKLAAQAHAADAIFHTDATQALGRVPVDFQALGVDLMTLSFHKTGGPKGIGAIIVREGLKVEPIMAGGHQERGRRPGTENTIAASGLDALCREVVAKIGAWGPQMEKQRRMVVDRLEQVDGFEVRGDQASRLPNTVNMAFQGVDGEDLLLALDLGGLALSSGSACTAGSLEPSHVVLAMGFEPQEARRSVRLSFGPTTTDQELEQSCSIIASTVDRLRRI